MEEVEGQVAVRMALSRRLTKVNERNGDFAPTTAPAIASIRVPRGNAMDAELMKVGELLLPKRLVALIDAELWPHTPEQARKLDHNCNVSKDHIHLFAPEEDQLYLAVPPFHTIAQRVSGNKSNFWSRFGALEQISPDLSVDIGFFGLGSDSAIVLDYRQGGDSNPPVLRLKWRKPEANVWVRCADSFDGFADMLGLDKS